MERVDLSEDFGYPELAFYTQMQPISGEFVPQALSVSGLEVEKFSWDSTPGCALGKTSQ